MPQAINAPKRGRLRRWLFTGLLMGMSFSVGVAVTIFIAVRVLFPIAATGMTLGMVAIVQAQSAAGLNVLYAGDSSARKTVLTQLKESFDAQPKQSFGDDVADLILPALKACRSDGDHDVVELADGLVKFIEDNTVSTQK